MQAGGEVRTPRSWRLEPGTCSCQQSSCPLTQRVQGEELRLERAKPGAESISEAGQGPSAEGRARSEAPPGSAEGLHALGFKSHNV